MSPLRGTFGTPAKTHPAQSKKHSHHSSLAHAQSTEHSRQKFLTFVFGCARRERAARPIRKLVCAVLVSREPAGHGYRVEDSRTLGPAHTGRPYIAAILVARFITNLFAFEFETLG